MSGNVYWITGLSGSGKSSLGKKLTEEIKKSGKCVVYLDGDFLREVFGNDLGYSKDDRRKSAWRNARLCQLLSSQNINVVCATISMFHEIHLWSRNNIKNYKEIYIKLPIETLKNRDKKNIYTSSYKPEIFEEPLTPDIILSDPLASIEEHLNKIKKELILS